MQNFKTFHTNFPLKTGLINVGRLWLQFRSVIGGKEVRIDSPFWDFGITVTCLWRVGVDWLGNPCAVRRSSEQRWSACSRSQYSSACATREEMGMRNTDYFLTITIGPTIARTNGLWLCLNWILHWENIFDNKAGVAFFVQWSHFCNNHQQPPFQRGKQLNIHYHWMLASFYFIIFTVHFVYTKLMHRNYVWSIYLLQINDVLYREVRNFPVPFKSFECYEAPLSNLSSSHLGLLMTQQLDSSLNSYLIFLLLPAHYSLLSIISWPIPRQVRAGNDGWYKEMCRPPLGPLEAGGGSYKGGMHRGRLIDWRCYAQKIVRCHQGSKGAAKIRLSPGPSRQNNPESTVMVGSQLTKC